MVKKDKDIIVKEANIRGLNVRSCPFGLPIPEACNNAGDSVKRMAPIDIDKDPEIEKEEDRDLAKANRLVYAYHKECKKCPYADKILEEQKKVDCDFGDTAEGFGSAPFIGSPLYPQTFSGIGLDGLYGYPLGFYADNNESRNLFFGLFSMLGFAKIEDLVKLGDDYDKCGEEDKADLMDKLLNKLQIIKNQYKDEFEKIEDYLAEYRQKYENKRADSGLLWQLSDAWFGSRQVNR